MGKAYARMLQRQGPTERPKIACKRQIFACMRTCTIPTTKMAGIDASDVAPAPSCTPTPPPRPARASRRALQALLRIGKCKCGVGEVQRARAAARSRWGERSRLFLGKVEAGGHDPGCVQTATSRI